MYLENSINKALIGRNLAEKASNESIPAAVRTFSIYNTVSTDHGMAAKTRNETVPRGPLLYAYMYKVSAANAACFMKRVQHLDSGDG